MTAAGSTSGSTGSAAVQAWTAALVAQIEGGLAFEAPDPPLTLDEAYDVQDTVLRRLEPRRGPRGGWKVAVTAAPLQQLLGVDHPLGGQIHVGQIRSDGEALPAARFLTPAIECEVVARIGTDVPDGDHDAASIAAFVEAVIPSFEIIDPRGANLPSIGGAGLVADRCACEGAVLGPAVTDWSSVDLAACEVELEFNGEVVDRGVTGTAMGHPFNGLAWVANHAASRGDRLRAGDIVLTGAVFAPRPVSAGDRFTYRIAGLGEVSASLA